jgi:hypothetical protein
MNDPTNHTDRARDARAISTPDAVRHDALASSIAIRLPLCSLDELRVIDVILERVLKIGRDSYAPLDLARDERDWGAEAAAELADTLFYVAAREVAANDRRLERLRCAAADELARANPVEHGLVELRGALVAHAVGCRCAGCVAERFDLGGEGGTI